MIHHALYAIFNASEVHRLRAQTSGWGRKNTSTNYFATWGHRVSDLEVSHVLCYWTWKRNPKTLFAFQNYGFWQQN